MRDALGSHIHLERLDDPPELLQQQLHCLLQRHCTEEAEEEKAEKTQ